MTVSDQLDDRGNLLGCSISIAQRSAIARREMDKNAGISRVFVVIQEWPEEEPFNIGVFSSVKEARDHINADLARWRERRYACSDCGEYCSCVTAEQYAIESWIVGGSVHDVIEIPVREGL